MENNELNFNYSECIKSYDAWGSTTYKNICNGEENTIPWGVVGYGGLIFFIILGVLLIGFIALIIRMIFDY